MEEKQRITEALRELRALKQIRFNTKQTVEPLFVRSRQSTDITGTRSSVDFRRKRMSDDAINLRSSLEVNHEVYDVRRSLEEAPENAENDCVYDDNNNNNDQNDNYDDSSFASTLSSVSEGSTDPDTDIILGLAIHNAEVNRVNLHEQALLLEQQRVLWGSNVPEEAERPRAVGFVDRVDLVEFDTAVDFNNTVYEMFATDEPAAPYSDPVFSHGTYPSGRRGRSGFDFDSEGSVSGLGLGSAGAVPRQSSSVAAAAYIRKQLSSSLPSSSRLRTGSPLPGKIRALRASSPVPAKRQPYVPPPLPRRVFSDPGKVHEMSRPPANTFRPSSATPTLGTDFPAIEKGDVLARHQAQLDNSVFTLLPADTLSLRVIMSGEITTADSERAVEKRLCYRKSDKDGLADGLAEQYEEADDSARPARRLNLATMEFLDFLQSFRVDFLCLVLDCNLQAVGTFDASSGTYLPGLAVAPEFLNFLRVRQKGDCGRTNLLHLDLQALPENTFAVVPLVLDASSGAAGLSEEVVFRADIFALREVPQQSLARGAAADFPAFLAFQQSLTRVIIDGYESNWLRGNEQPELAEEPDTYRQHLEGVLAQYAQAEAPDRATGVTALWSRLGDQTFSRTRSSWSMVPFVVFRLKSPLPGARRWAVRTLNGSLRGSSLRAVYEPLLGLLRAHNVLPYKLVHVEHCENCETHQLTTRHAPGSYEKAFMDIIMEFSRRLPPVVLYSNLTSRQREPRMGAFEVQLERYEDCRATLVYSKIRRKRFPIMSELLDELAAIIIPRIEVFAPSATPVLCISLRNAHSKVPSGRALVTVFRVDSVPVEGSGSGAGMQQCLPCGPSMESQAFARVRTWGRAEVVRWLRVFGASEFAVTNIVNAGVVDGAAMLKMVNTNSLRAWGVNNRLILQRLLLDLESIKAGLPDEASVGGQLHSSAHLVSVSGSNVAELGSYYEAVTESYSDDQGSLSVRIDRSGMYCFRVVSDGAQEYCSRFLAVPCGASGLRLHYTALLHPRLVPVTFSVSVRGKAGLIGRQDAGALICLVHLASCKYHYVLFRECNNIMRSSGEGKVVYQLQQWLPQGAYLSLVDGRVLHLRGDEPTAVEYGDAAVRKCHRRAQRRCVKLFQRAFSRYNQGEKAKAMFALLLIRIKLKRKLIRIRENIRVRKIVRLQSFLRRCSLRSLYTAKQRAATRIQSHVRRWRAQRVAQRIRSDPHAGSKSRTVFTLMRSLGFQTVKAKVQIIGNLILKRVHQRRRQKTEATLKIQTFARRTMQLKKERKIQLIKGNLRGLRSFSRLMAKNVQNKRDAQRVAAEMAEAERLRLENKRNEKARAEQKRREEQEKEYRHREDRAAAKKNKAAAKIQRTTRKVAARTKYQKARSGIVKLQRRFRRAASTRQGAAEHPIDSILLPKAGKYKPSAGTKQPLGRWAVLAGPLASLLGRDMSMPADEERSRVLLQSIARMWLQRRVYLQSRASAGNVSPLPLRSCRAMCARPSATQKLVNRALPLAWSVLLSGQASLQSLMQNSGASAIQQTLAVALDPRQLAVGVRGLRRLLRRGRVVHSIDENTAARRIQAQWRGALHRCSAYRRLPELALCLSKYHVHEEVESPVTDAEGGALLQPVDRPRFRPAGLTVSTAPPTPLEQAKESLRFLTSTAPGTPLARIRDGLRDQVAPVAMAGLASSLDLGLGLGELLHDLGLGVARLHEGLSQAREAAEEYVAQLQTVNDRAARREGGVIAIHDALLLVTGVQKKSLPERPLEWYITVLCQPAGGSRKEKAEITSSPKVHEFSPQRIGELSLHTHLTDLHRYDEVLITLHMQAGDARGAEDGDPDAGAARSGKRFVAAFAGTVFLSQGLVFGPAGGRALTRLLPLPSLVYVPGSSKLADAKSIDVFVTLMPVAVPSTAYLSTLHLPQQPRSHHPWHLIDAEYLEPAPIQWDAINGSAVCSEIWHDRIFVSVRSKTSSMALAEFDLDGKFVGELGEPPDALGAVLLIVGAHRHVAFCSNKGRMMVLSEEWGQRPLHLQVHPGVHITAAAALSHAGLDFFFTSDKANNICVTIVERGECARCCLNASFLTKKIVSMMAFRSVLYLCLQDGSVSLLSLRDILGGSLEACSSLAKHIIVQYPIFRGAGIACSALLACDEHRPQPEDSGRLLLKCSPTTYHKRSPKAAKEHQDDIRVFQGPTLFFGGDDSDPVIKVYHGLQGNKLIPVAVLEGHTKEITSLVLDSGGRYLFSGSSAEKKIKVWDLLSFSPEIEFSDAAFVSLAGGPDALLATSFRGPYLRLWRSSKRISPARPALLLEDVITSIRHPRWAYAALKKVLPSHRVGQRSIMRLPNSINEYGADPQHIVAMWRSVYNKGLPIAMHVRAVARQDTTAPSEQQAASETQEDGRTAGSSLRTRRKGNLHFSDSEDSEEEGGGRLITNFPPIRKRTKVSIHIVKYDDVEEE